ncbi:MAG TPA: HEXXH motif-containing putative peptide modification protein [Thermoanaerobaculia bacterium]|nr:HEXXH motif-containing putative peptide modification protein [Thermoanaerobaculia bacterium]
MQQYAGFLTIPRDEPGEAVALLRKVHLLAIRTLFHAPADARVAALRDWLQILLHERPDAVIEAIGSPDVLPFVLSRAPVPSFAPNLLAALGTSSENFLWDAPFRELVIGDRVATFDPSARAILINPAGITIELASGAVWNGSPSQQAAISLLGHVQLALHDTNPLAAIEAHPDKSGNALSFGGRAIEEWEHSIREALALIAQSLPAWLNEFRRVMRRLVPVGYDAERHVSASYREAPGIAYLSLHPDPLTMAEAIVHESQHTKLNVATWLDPVLRNGQTCWTQSPVRPDLRPLLGVLLALHAFVPVSVMHRVLAESGHPIARERRFDERRREVLATNEKSLAIVRQHADPTPLGERIISALEQTLRALH